MKQYNEAVQKANILIEKRDYKNALHQLNDAIEYTIYIEQKIDTFNTIARLHLTLNDVENAIKFFKKTLEIHLGLDEEKASLLVHNKAGVLNNLGAIYKQRDIKKSISYHKEALEIFKSKVEKEENRDFQIHLANTQFSLGEAYYIKKDYFNANKSFRAAIDIYENIDKRYLNMSNPMIANAYYNLGNISTDKDDLKTARGYLTKALIYYQKLVNSNPTSFRPLLAATLNNLAVVTKMMYIYTDAIKYYESALEHYKILVENDRNTFLPYYAATLNSIGIIYTEQHEVKDDYDSYGLSGFSGFGTLTVDNLEDDKKKLADQYQKEKAIEYYQQAVNIYSELVKYKAEEYNHYLATTFHNLGVLHDGKNDFDKGENYYFKALKIRRSLAELQPKAFNLDLCVTLLNLTTLYQSIMENKLEISYKDKALNILKEVESILSSHKEDQSPVVLSMKSDTQYFTQYFRNVDEEYIEILKVFGQADMLTNQLLETLIPQKKLSLQKSIILLLERCREKHPNNVRLKDEMLDAYTFYSWIAIRSNELFTAEAAIRNGSKIEPDYLSLRANKAHLLLIKGQKSEALKIYRSLMGLNNEENIKFEEVLTKDLKVLKMDGVLKEDIENIKEEIKI